MKKVAIYARYSSDKQNQRSIEDQLRICQNHSDQNGWTVVGRYMDEAISGESLLTRKGIQRLLSDARDDQFDIVLSEALDRLSRDTEGTAHIHNQLKFCDVEIFTLSEGRVDEMQVGFKGTMNSMFLKELSRKTHRGLEGRALKGKSAGGISYGYNVVRAFGADGVRVTGERTIDDAHAAIVRRIFTDYVKGISPKKIATTLNAEGVTGPTGKGWTQSTINGNRQRGTGILNNELYIGRQVWNKVRYVKDPNTGKRVARINDEADWVITEVPQLRIVDQDVWDKVKEYQGALDKRPRLQSKRRPTHLLSYLLECGECGGGMSIVGKDRYGCSTARNKGTCGNRTTISKTYLEEAVLGALRTRLMDDELTKVFCEEYTAHLNRMRMERNAAITRNRKELEKVNRDLDRTFDAYLEGVSKDYTKERMAVLEARKAELESFLDSTEEAPVYVHPNMGQRYADAIRNLLFSLNEEEHRAETSKIIRSLVEKIILTPSADHSELVVDMKGDLAAILSMADAHKANAMPKSADKRQSNERKEVEQIEAMLTSLTDDPAFTLSPRQEKLVAGAGFEPATFRL